MGGNNLKGAICCAALCTFINCASPVSAYAQAAPNEIKYEWKNANIGAGGYITGIIFSDKNPNNIAIRTDIGGAYLRTSDKWLPLVDFLPHDEAGLNGALSIAFDPNDNQKLYVLAGEYTNSNATKAAFLISSDLGKSFKTIKLPFWVGGNENGRGSGERIAINPKNPSEIWIGTTKNGLWKSTDGGLKWSQNAFAKSHVLFAIFAQDGSLYISIANENTQTAGLFKSNDNGKSFINIKGIPQGHNILQGKFDNSGNLIATTGDKIGPNDIKSGAIFKITPDDNVIDISPPKQNDTYGYSGISISSDSKTLIASTIDKWVTHDEIYISNNGGKNWKSINKTSVFDLSQAPWLLDYYRGQMHDIGHWITDVEIDPFDNNHALYVTGYGLWETHNLQSPQIKWSFNVKGIEETAIIDLKSPPKGPHLISAVGDISGFTHYNLDNSGENSLHKPFLGNTRSVDYSNTIYTRTTDKAPYGLYSNDKGQNWTGFKTTPPELNYYGGDIRISESGKSLVWLIGDKCYYSNDNGNSWQTSKGLDAVKPNSTIIAEKSEEEKFYIYNSSDGKLLKSVDGGKIFTPTKSAITPWAGAIKAVPDNPNHIWAATYNGVYASDDGGDNFIKIAPFDAAWSIAFGKAAANADYPAIFVAGKIADKEGIFMSVDMGEKWIRISNQDKQFSSIRNMEGDPRILGRLYIGTDGRGIFYGDLKINQTPMGDKNEIR
jgi:photosystem II stability/assembly factor-like uncharacterized protein